MAFQTRSAYLKAQQHSVQHSIPVLVQRQKKDQSTYYVCLVFSALMTDEQKDLFHVPPDVDIFMITMDKDESFEYIQSFDPRYLDVVRDLQKTIYHYLLRWLDLDLSMFHWQVSQTFLQGLVENIGIGSQLFGWDDHGTLMLDGLPVFVAQTSEIPCILFFGNVYARWENDEIKTSWTAFPTDSTVATMPTIPITPTIETIP